MARPLKPVSAVPVGAWLLLAGALAAQLLWSASHNPRAHAQPLANAPPAALLRVASLGDPLAASRAAMLYVQSHDDQAGVSLPLRALDYGRLRGWLDSALALDPRSQYPLQAAMLVYGADSERANVGLMLDFVADAFAADPARRWPWLAQAAIAAKHRLHDMPRALRYARALRTAPSPAIAPWARQLEALLLRDAGQLEAARAVAGALLADGRITDPNEVRWLERWLEQLERDERKERAAPYPSK